MKLTPHDQDYIRKNYKTQPIKMMAKVLGIPYSRIHEWMRKVELQSTHSRAKVKQAPTPSNCFNWNDFAQSDFILAP